MTHTTATMTYRAHHTAGTFPLLKVLARFLSHAGSRLHLAHILMTVASVLVLMYGISLYSIISNTVALQQTNRQSAALTTEIEALDTLYLTLSNKITPDTLASYGLEKGEVSFFIPRTQSLGRVALGGHEL
jgi:hypothetical protein